MAVEFQSGLKAAKDECTELIDQRLRWWAEEEQLRSMISVQKEQLVQLHSVRGKSQLMEEQLERT